MSAHQLSGTASSVRLFELLGVSDTVRTTEPWGRDSESVGEVDLRTALVVAAEDDSLYEELG
jgi:hypothetical protein